MKQGFISYAHEDERMFDHFRKQLKPVEKSTEVEFWVDKRLRAGDRWHESIGDALKAADAILLCISAGFVWSTYIEKYELPLIRERAENGAVVIPVIFKDVIWDHLSVQVYQAVPDAAKAIQLWRPQASGFRNAAEKIREALREAWT